MKKAREVFDLANEVEAADLATRTEAAIERARSAKSASDQAISASAASQVQALGLQDTATALGQGAERPNVDVAATAKKGRELVVQAMSSWALGTRKPPPACCAGRRRGGRLGEAWSRVRGAGRRFLGRAAARRDGLAIRAGWWTRCC